MENMLKCIKLIFSFIFIVVGLCIISISKIAEEVVPMNGFYNVNLTLNYWIGALAIIGGSIYLFINSKAYLNILSAVIEKNAEFEESNKINKEE
jgi:hypothetical protein